MRLQRLKTGLGILLLLLTPVAIAGGPQKRAAPKKAAKESIEALEQQWRQAQLTGDVTAMDKLLSDDYVGIPSSGQVYTKSQQLQRVRGRVVQLSKLELSDIKVKLIGSSVAVVTSRAEVAGTNEGKPMMGAFRYTRVYQRLPGGVWKITSFESTRVPGSGKSADEAGKP